jgi:hypothetical protein
MATKRKSKYRTEYVGDIGVDSGQIVIGDPCYATDINPESFNFKKLYEPVGTANLAFRIESGLGDGLYPVDVDIKDGRVAAIHIWLERD